MPLIPVVTVAGARRSVHLGRRPDGTGAAQRLSASVRASRLETSDVAAGSQ